MKWPWSSAEVDAARLQEERARVQRVAAECRSREIDITIQEATKVNADLQTHLERNGFTELLKKSFGPAR